MNRSNQEKGKTSTFTIALGGVLTALTIVSVLVASFIPGIELTMYAISSIFVAAMIIETGPKGGVLIFVVSALLALVVVPNKLGILPFIFFFGHYGILKFYIEKLKNPVVQVALKVGAFGVVFGVGFFFFRKIFFGNIELPDFPEGVLIALGIVVFLLYDGIFSGVINVYMTKVRPKIIQSKR